MHPNRAFRFADDAAMLDYAVEVGFAHIFASSPDGPVVVHAPLARVGSAIRFHVARSNRATPHLDGAAILASVAGPDGYVTPNWYEHPKDQVPTWNYVAVEIDGIARQIDEAGLREQLEALADTHEPRPNPWTLTKTDPVKVDAMLRAISGFEIEVTAVRGTAKLHQHRSEAEREGVRIGLRAQGNAPLADAIP